jgi:hypothetical protein
VSTRLYCDVPRTLENSDAPSSAEKSWSVVKGHAKVDVRIAKRSLQQPALEMLIQPMFVVEYFIANIHARRFVNGIIINHVDTPIVPNLVNKAVATINVSRVVQSHAHLVQWFVPGSVSMTPAPSPAVRYAFIYLSQILKLINQVIVLRPLAMRLSLSKNAGLWPSLPFVVWRILRDTAVPHLCSPKRTGECRGSDPFSTAIRSGFLVG